MKSIPLSYGNTATPVGYDEGIRVTLPNIAALEKLPASGTITFRFSREDLHVRKDDSISAEICLCELLDVEADEAAEEKKDDVVDKLFAEAKQDAEESEDDEEKE